MPSLPHLKPTMHELEFRTQIWNPMSDSSSCMFLLLTQISIEGDFLGEKLSRKEDSTSRVATESSLTSETAGEARTGEPSTTVLYRPVQTETPEPSYGSSHAGLVIGILLTVISLLIGAILYVVYQVRY